MHVNAHRESTKNARKWMSEFKEYGCVLEYNALLISIGTHIVEASQNHKKIN